MSDKKPSQSFSITGGQVSNNQIAVHAGRHINICQEQVFGESDAKKPLAQADAVQLIAQLEELFRESGLSEAQTAKAIQHLEIAKEEAQKELPDKEFTAKNLQRATNVLREAGETVEAGTGLWKKVQPIVERLLPWLGVGAKFLKEFATKFFN